MIYEMGDEIQSKLNLKSKTHHIQLPSMFRLCPSLTQQAWEAPFTSHFMLATAHFCSCCTIHLLALPKPHVPPTSLHLINYIHLSSTSLLSKPSHGNGSFQFRQPSFKFHFYTYDPHSKRRKQWLPGPQKC